MIKVYQVLFVKCSTEFWKHRYISNSRINCFKQNRKMSFLFEDKQFFLFLCLRTSKILSLGEFNELKSHLFLVHFSVLFSVKIE